MLQIVCCEVEAARSAARDRYSGELFAVPLASRFKNTDSELTVLPSASIDLWEFANYHHPSPRRGEPSARPQIRFEGKAYRLLVDNLLFQVPKVLFECR